jgi:hypothetical protein
MSADCIAFDSASNRFQFDGQIQYTGAITFRDGVAVVSDPENGCGVDLTPAVIGQIIGESLMSTETIQFDTCSVSVNYLVEMLRIARKRGRFYDCLSNTEDHRFDGNHPTPGGNYGALKAARAEVRAEIKLMTQYACGARAAYMTSEADQAEQRITELRQTNKELTY